jgi:signal transduction histidine kinase
VGSDPDLFLATYVSNQPYEERLHRIRGAVLYVLALGASLTALLSFFLSKNISRPVKELLKAMQSVKNGRYDATMPTLPPNEIGELFRGFNDMARTLGEDRAQMDRYIGEILQLKDYNEKIVRSLRAGIAIIGGDMTVVRVNGAFLDFFHLKEEGTAGRRIDSLGLEVIDPELLRNIGRVVRGDRGFFSKVKRTRGGKVFEIKLYPLAGGSASEKERPADAPLDAQGRYAPATAPVIAGGAGCVLTTEDISEKVELEHKIFQAEKLASLSILSAGVAHEINNPLGSIMSNVQNLLEEERAEEKRTALKWIEQETRRIAKIIRELLNFSSSGRGDNAGCDVKEVIEGVVGLIRYSIKKEKNIAIETELTGDLPRSVIDEDELKQVIINLVYNSIQAIEESGSVRVRAFRDGAGAQNGGSIGVSVEDDGKGMSGEILHHVFDPFFTTKNGSGGTGLGLSVVYGIVKKYSGAIDVRSAEGKGTSVRLLLPARKT